MPAQRDYHVFQRTTDLHYVPDIYWVRPQLDNSYIRKVLEDEDLQGRGIFFGSVRECFKCVGEYHSCSVAMSPDELKGEVESQAMYFSAVEEYIFRRTKILLLGEGHVAHAIMILQIPAKFVHGAHPPEHGIQKFHLQVIAQHHGIYKDVLGMVTYRLQGVGVRSVGAAGPAESREVESDGLACEWLERCVEEAADEAEAEDVVSGAQGDALVEDSVDKLPWQLVHIAGWVGIY